MQTDASAKQLVVERIKNATNILVTVSHDPSVDELSAALGLTLLLNKLDKHATAVFSGKIPPAIEFLQPGKTFENTVDSLRDFIIALDKEKADRLRYKVEDDVVRIFITPYRTVISQDDLKFSQGDFNVELVLALGVEKREDLDQAITAHGRILHDAPVVTINNRVEKSSLGAVDWSEGSASSLCEMLMGLSEALGSGLLDEQIATALLTGIVAATERFRNTQTSPKVMTMAAQLMAAGANQQLIAAKLEEGSLLPKEEPKNPDGTKKLEENKSEKVKAEEVKVVEKAKADGEMTIDHDLPAAVPDLPLPTPSSKPSPAPVVGDEPTKTEVDQENAVSDAEAALDQVVDTQTPTLSVEDLKKDIEAANQEVNNAATEVSGAPSGQAQSLNPVVSDSSTARPIADVKGDWRDRSVNQPSFGGTLNATADAAEQDKLREELSTRNHTLLTHDGGLASEPSFGDDQGSESDEPPLPTLDVSPPRTISPLTQTDQVEEQPASSDPFAGAPKTEPDAPLAYEETPPSTSTLPTLSELEAQAHEAAAPNTLNDARAAVDAALDALPFDPANQPLVGVGAQPLGTVEHTDPVPVPQPVEPATTPDFTGQTPVLEPLPVPNDVPQAVPALPSMPPLPDFSTLPPDPMVTAPVMDSPHTAVEPSMPTQPATIAPADPGQFKLPGQP